MYTMAFLFPFRAGWAPRAEKRKPHPNPNFLYSPKNPFFLPAIHENFAFFVMEM